MKKNVHILIIAIPVSIFAIIMLWTGFEGLLVNINGELKTFTIREVEEQGLGSARFVEINKGNALGQYMPMTDEYGRILKVFYPIGSTETISKIYKGKKIKINVLVEDATVNPDSIKIIIGEINIKGITTRDIDMETRKTISKLNNELIEISDNIVIVQDGTKPRAMFWNIIMIVCSVIFLFYVLTAISKTIRSSSVTSNQLAVNNDQLSVNKSAH